MKPLAAFIILRSKKYTWQVCETAQCGWPGFNYQ